MDIDLYFQGISRDFVIGQIVVISMFLSKLNTFGAKNISDLAGIVSVSSSLKECSSTKRIILYVPFGKSSINPKLASI